MNNSMKLSSMFVFLFCLALLFAGVGAAAAAPVVLFDQAHTQQFLVGNQGPLDLSGFAKLFSEQGAEIRTGTTLISENSLADVDVLLVSGAFTPFVESEIEAILIFLERGGKVALMTHIPSPYMSLTTRLGVSISNGVVLEQENIVDSNAQDFMVEDLTAHPLSNGIEYFTVYGGWALLERNKKVVSIARTSPWAWVDLDKNGELNKRDAMQAFSVILAGKVGQGDFVVFGDDAIFQNRFLKDGNYTLAKNLAVWFCEQRESNLVQL
jgi:Domain of unknown function (DUF4350)